jgi:PPOX class probable F420-dependent enzyme
MAVQDDLDYLLRSASLPRRTVAYMTPSVSPLDVLGAARYVLLTSFRKDGTPVATPVWAARDGNWLAVWTAADSGKVKRIRRSGRVTVAPCTARGKPLGPAVPAQAMLMDDAETRRVRGLIKRKYRITGPLLVTLSLWRRGEQGSVGIGIVLDGPG